MNASEMAQVTSVEIAEMIALQTKSHTLAESIISPACRKMVKTIIGDEAEQEISKIPLSNNTILRRIMDFSADIEENVQIKVQNSEFALQVDESTDISNKTQLLTFIRFIDGNQTINQFFCCEEMPLTTRGQDIFDILSAYLEKWNLSWNSCVGICTNGAASMIGSIKGFVSLVQQQNPNVIRIHCFQHREELVSKTIPVALKQVLNQVVEMVNYIKSRPLKYRLFEQIYVDMDSQNKRLLLHTKVR
ncbi:domain-containing 3 [Octopus vulgaris]|uniref:Domain-containing 3 n=1 Tax=Octopus vulgaris TaxID=6645 RepID=A0AA36AK41_OCTVU|nr:domain-containing 3 [Octopus vulgaris]